MNPNRELGTDMTTTGSGTLQSRATKVDMYIHKEMVGWICPVVMRTRPQCTYEDYVAERFFRATYTSAASTLSEYYCLPQVLGSFIKE